MNKSLNIITLNIPYPPDYGGMIDSFYRLKALHSLGIKIHLHCFEYGRSHSRELESFCESVSYYPRETGFTKQLSPVPYIVVTRKNKGLLEALGKNDYPILFDGLHSTFFMKHPDLFKRRKIVRMHNVEHKYYQTLFENERNQVKKLYFRIEALKLKRYEKVLELAECILPISETEHEYFMKRYHNSVYLAPFHPYLEPDFLLGFGDNILYHGDLSVNENEIIASSLIDEVFSKISLSCIIAGKNPSARLLAKASAYSNIKVIANPGDNEMRMLIKNAQIQLIPAMTSNGFKLKLLLALYGGRHCIVNSVLANTADVNMLCHIADTNEEILEKIHWLMNEPFTEEMVIERKDTLLEKFNNNNNAKKLIDIIFPA